MHRGDDNRKGVLLTLSDRLIRVSVVDRNGRSVPATIKVFVNGNLVTTATAAQDRSGSFFTVQISDPSAQVQLEASYGNASPQSVTLTSTVEEWRFKFNDVEMPVDREKSFWEEHIAGVLGVVFLVIGILLAIVFPTPTPYQRRIFVGAFAIALAGVGAEILGFCMSNSHLARSSASPPPALSRYSCLCTFSSLRDRAGLTEH
jgi:hypothetical protein